MEELGRIHQLLVPLTEGYTMTFNLEVILMTWIVIGILLFFGFMAVKKRHVVPGPMQVVGELFVKNLYDLADDALEEELGKKYAPMICALFLFLWMSNMLGLLPPIPGIPEFAEPTKDLNTPLGLGLLGFVIAHAAGIKAKGFKAYITTYFEPFAFMMPLNLIGELAKVVSISFRLFGNIMGGSIIILVVSHLTYSILIPPALFGFFGVFVGTIQAFVFTMLTTVYISVQVK
ncbi:MAG: F0F1 ATP synthase subunit A [Desulfatibacillum sp.]|nr:F0F1 ATP synthase subunit A [Desulfatibacillum sp.]